MPDDNKGNSNTSKRQSIGGAIKKTASEVSSQSSQEAREAGERADEAGARAYETAERSESMRKGGRVDSTGLRRLHAGELVIPRSIARRLRRLLNRRSGRSDRRR